MGMLTARVRAGFAGGYVPADRGWSAVGQDGEPGLWVRGSGRCWQLPEPGENLGKQAVAGREPQHQVAGVADQPPRDGDQPPPQGGDHGLAAAHAVSVHDVLACGAGGELVQPGGHARGEQRAPHPRKRLTWGISRRADAAARHRACCRGTGSPPSCDDGTSAPQRRPCPGWTRPGSSG